MIVFRARTYGVTEDKFAEMMAAQGDACAVCRLSFLDVVPHVDHCHDSGAPRGLLCRDCNLGLGNFRDDVAVLLAAVAYLRQAEAQNC
jgi:hypothetical protein